MSHVKEESFDTGYVYRVMIDGMLLRGLFSLRSVPGSVCMLQKKKIRKSDAEKV